MDNRTGCSSPVQLMLFIDQYLHLGVLPCNIYLEKNLCMPGVTYQVVGQFDGLSVLKFPSNIPSDVSAGRSGYIFLCRYTLVVGPMAEPYLSTIPISFHTTRPDLVRNLFKNWHKQRPN